MWGEIVPLDVERLGFWQQEHGPYCSYRSRRHHLTGESRCRGEVKEMLVRPNSAVSTHKKEIVRPLCEHHAQFLRDRDKTND